MTRTIKFRGITASKPHRWVEGDLIRGKSEKAFIIVHNNHPIRKGSEFWWIDAPCFEVLPETVGQFTGLTDKDGKEIFEGDILIIDPERQITVAWNATYASWCLYSSNWVYMHWFGESCDPEDCTITGTIHDNLLEGGKNERFTTKTCLAGR